MRILVTGAGGYLGSKIVDNLTFKGISVYSCTREKCDLLNNIQVKLLIKSISPDRIIHCAAFVPKNLDEYNDDRNKLSLVMLDNIIKESTCPIIYISSHTADNPTTKYAKYKLIGEDHLQASGRAGVSVRIAGLFGRPRQNGLIYNMLRAVKFQYAYGLTLSDDFTEWTGLPVDEAAKEIIRIATQDISGYRLESIHYYRMTKEFIESLIKFSEDI